MVKEFPPKIGNKTESINKITTLIGEKAVVYNEHFSNLVRGEIKTNNEKMLSLEKSLFEVGLGKEVISYKLKEWRGLHLYRVFISGALTKNSMREKFFLDKKSVEDPFC